MIRGLGAPAAMRIIGPSEVHAALDFPSLVEALRQMFRGGYETPVGRHHQVPVPGQPDATLHLAPVWQAGRHIGVKVTTRSPGNDTLGMPTTLGLFLLLDGKTGDVVAVIDGPALIQRRTAAASALAATYLARPDSERLLMIGTGAMAAHLVEAHATVRPIRNVLVWGRDPVKAERLAHRLDRRNLKVAATTDLPGAIRGAHVISCATLSTEALIRGEWLPLGVHVDLVGASTPEMREADEEVMRRGRVFVDTRAGACREGGDIVQAFNTGALTEDDIAGDLVELARGARAGRRFHDQITVFKSVGTTLEDLAAAQLAIERVRQ